MDRVPAAQAHKQERSQSTRRSPNSSMAFGRGTQHTYIHTQLVSVHTYIHTYIQTYIHDNVVCRRAAAAEPAEPAQQQQPEEEGTPDPEEDQQQQDADKEYWGPEVVLEYF